MWVPGSRGNEGDVVVVAVVVVVVAVEVSVVGSLQWRQRLGPI